MNKYLINKIKGLQNIKNDEILRYELSGIFAMLIFSKDIFKSNSKIKDFLLTIDQSDFDFKNWVMKTRTIIIGKVLRNIYLADEETLNKYSQNIQNFIIDIPVPNEESKHTIQQPKKEENYMEYLLKKYSRNR